ncbi:hypothetical protein [Stenotrophomonas sp. NPDC077659]|uniref:hypothetical protein n=1 Tax=Stenotrophomonas sp. NPDC077659 TaxID=3390694 RepID=UPI003D034492
MLLRNIAVTCLPNDDSLKCAGIVYMRKGEGGSAGLAALHLLQAEAEAEAESEAGSKAALGCFELGGVVWAGRTRRKPIHGGS